MAKRTPRKPKRSKSKKIRRTKSSRKIVKSHSKRRTKSKRLRSTGRKSDKALARSRSKQKKSRRRGKTLRGGVSTPARGSRSSSRAKTPPISSARMPSIAERSSAIRKRRQLAQEQERRAAWSRQLRDRLADDAAARAERLREQLAETPEEKAARDADLQAQTDQQIAQIARETAEEPGSIEGVVLDALRTMVEPGRDFSRALTRAARSHGWSAAAGVADRTAQALAHIPEAVAGARRVSTPAVELAGHFVRGASRELARAALRAEHLRREGAAAAGRWAMEAAERAAQARQLPPGEADQRRLGFEGPTGPVHPTSGAFQAAMQLPRGD